MKQTQNVQVLLALPLLAVLLLFVGNPSCGSAAPRNEPPTILRLLVESSNVAPGLTIALEVQAIGTGTLSYLWSAEDGEFTETEEPATTWTAPMDEGTVLITVQVMGGGAATSVDVPIVVGSGGDADGDGFSVIDGDCDDSDDTVFPGAPEGQDLIDNDCDGQVDEGGEDVDDDGDGFTDIQGDCDDTDDSVFPGALEVVNERDDNCNGLVDDGTPAYDDDGDGFSEDEGDCDDNNGGIHPAAAELLDGVDNDCDGVLDENTVGFDDDGDGFTELQGDCDDGDSATFPGALELSDSADNDCNGIIDDGSVVTDDDGDGWSDYDGDCDDQNLYTYPGAPEVADGQDNDCDGSIDEDMDTTDDDGDGFTEAQGDCNDNNALIYPGAIELDDGIDNDCDGRGYSGPPIAAAGVVTSNPRSCQSITVTAVNSYDPDGDTLDFVWFFSTKPLISALVDDDIVDRFEMEASFTADAAGYWAVALQVTDGTWTSQPSTVGFTVPALDGNQPPVADFLTNDIVGAANSSCGTDAYGGCAGCDACSPDPAYTINAGASYDPDGDTLRYVWEAAKVTGDGSQPDLVDNGNATADVDFDMSVSCGDSSWGLYEVQVTVIDCNGASDTATVQIDYTCTD